MQPISLVPSPSLREQLEQASAVYEKQVNRAADYLQRRGITKASATYSRLGVVHDPVPGHEMYRGRLSIPYVTRAGLTTMRFRHLPRIVDDQEEPYDGPKYLSLPSDPPRIYNPGAFFRPETHIAICEGEIDAITASQCGIPATGIAGVSGWRSLFAKCYEGYQKVFILADSDDKGQGMKFAQEIAEEVQNALIVPMPAGHDVNSFVVSSGPEALKELLKIE